MRPVYLKRHIFGGADGGVGIHKHFHLLALHKYMLDNGHIHPRNQHTKPTGIWRKLHMLYNLEALDEREDARQLEKVVVPVQFRGDSSGGEEASSDASDDADVYSEAANKIENEDFDLPGEEFAQMKWAHRLATEKPGKDESPAVLPELNLAGEAPVRFTPSFSIEPSETATPVSRSRGRPRAGTGGAKTRPAEATAAAATTGRRRSTRQVESVADQEAEAEEEGAEEDGEDDDNEDEEDQSAASTPVRSSRRGKGAQSRGTPQTKTRQRRRRR